jgi:hypothetical protein
MKVIPCGVEVLLKRAEYPGVITGINIRDNRVTYEISYYESGTYKSNWYCEYEFSVDTEQKGVTIGFTHI